ncbi:MAG TPA: YfhO family protein [Thermoanaerobaculia bacterium]|nr:YfhO family protein [Thermoanaerobaculia bacterium]
MFNPTWLYAGIVYAGAIALARRAGLDLPKRVATFFFALVFVFLYLPLTQDYVNLPVDFLKTLPPWVYTTSDPHSINGQLNDLTLQIVPWAHQVREGWKSLKPPLWNAASACGYPLLASAQSSALSPLRLLGLPLSLAHAMTFEAAMKILIALTFMFLWCRRRGYSEMASVIGATAFGFSTFITVWLHFPLITTACFVPAVFYLIDLIAEQPTYPRFVAFASVWALMLFGGHPETVSHTFFLATLYVIWIAVVERGTPKRFLLTLIGALAVAGLLAAPLLAPFAEAVTKSKRYQELAASKPSAEVPFSDWPSAIVLFQPEFFGEVPRHSGGPTHTESISGFAGYLGVAAWVALLAHVIATRRWRSREAFFVLATVIVLGVIMSWPGVSELFHVVFRLAANARLRLMFALLLAIQTAAAVDLFERDRRSVLIGLACASAFLVVMYHSIPWSTAVQRDTAMIAMMPSMAVLVIALVCTMTRHWFAVLVLLTAIVWELWAVGYEWNPVILDKWMYPKTPLLRALDDLRAKVLANEPFRISANGAAFFPNVSAVYGYEDVRAHDPMTNGRYIGLLSWITDYDAPNYFAEWTEWEKHFVDYLNVRYVITSWRGELPPRYRMLYDGFDGRIFENTEALPRFFAVRNVIIDFNDDSFYRRLKETEGWSHTAFLDKLELENQQMHDDFFKARPENAPLATAKIVQAKPTDYRLYVKAPRYSLVVSSVPYWPGWKVERNGARIEPIRVNGGFLGFAVPPGELDVRVWYDPWTFRFGAIVALATLAALIAYRVVKR